MKTVLFYKGIDVETLSREELIEALKEASKEIDDLYAMKELAIRTTKAICNLAAFAESKT